MVAELTGGLGAPRPEIGRHRVRTERHGHALSSDSQLVALVVAREASDRRRRIGQKWAAFAPPRRSASASPLTGYRLADQCLAGSPSSSTAS
jgi:hypothetical protein